MKFKLSSLLRKVFWLLLMSLLVFAQVALSAELSTAEVQANVRMDDYDSKLTDIYINVKSFGAIGDGETDDTAAINAAIAASAKGQTLFFPDGTYITNAAIVIAKAINVIMDGTISYAGSENIAVLTVGCSDYTWNLRYVLRAIRETDSDWTDEASVSIVLMNMYSCDITIMNAEGSTIGLMLLADAKGFCYNTISLFEIRDNKYGVDLNAKNSGWCSENLLLGGRFMNSSSTHLNLSRYGIRIRSVDNSYLSNGNNVFQKPSFELTFDNLTDGAEAVPIVITAGHENYFNLCRVEDCSPTLIRDTIQNNYVTIGYIDEHIGYIVENLNARNCGTTLEILSEVSNQQRNAPYKIFDSGPLFKRACYYEEGSWTDHYYVGVPGMLHLTINDGELLRAYYGEIHNDYIRLTDSYLGVYVKTGYARNFTLLREFFDSSGTLRFIVRCYDAGMNILDGTSDYYVKGSYWDFTWMPGPKGYEISIATADDIFFQVTDDVKYMYIGVQGSFRSFALYADKMVTAYSPFDTSEGPNVGTTFPEIGTHLAGRRVVNAAPSSGSPIAWVCTVSGTSDSISTTCTADNSDVVVVANAQELDFGQFISIDGGAALQILAIDGTHITMSDNVAAGRGLSFVNSPAVWVSEGDLGNNTQAQHGMFWAGTSNREGVRL